MHSCLKVHELTAKCENHTYRLSYYICKNILYISIMFSIVVDIKLVKQILYVNKS